MAEIKDVVKDVCKIGQGHLCCRYLLMGADGWECGKLDKVLKRIIDSRNDMVAKSDNCEGKTKEELN